MWGLLKAFKRFGKASKKLDKSIETAGIPTKKTTVPKKRRPRPLSGARKKKKRPSLWGAFRAGVVAAKKAYQSSNQQDQSQESTESKITLPPIAIEQAAPQIKKEPERVPDPIAVSNVTFRSADNAIETRNLIQNQEFWAHLDTFLKSQNSSHTARAYEKDLVDFLAYLKVTEKPMSVHTLVEYREKLRTNKSVRTGEPLSHVSINRKIATIKSFLNWLVLNSVIPNNPAKAVKSFRAGRESPTRDIPNDYVKRMLEIPNRHKVSGCLHRAILSTLFHLGLRRSELVGLRTSDFFEQDGMRVIRVRGKGDKERILPLPAAVSESIDAYLYIAKKDLKQDQILFTPEKNNVTRVKDKILNPNSIAYIVKHYAKLAGVPYRVSPHSARATAVSNALDHAAPHRAVQHMAGWSSPLMVTRYDKRKEDLRNSAVKFVKYEEDDDTIMTV